MTSYVVIVRTSEGKILYVQSSVGQIIFKPWIFQATKHPTREMAQAVFNRILPEQRPEIVQVEEEDHGDLDR